MQKQQDNATQSDAVAWVRKGGTVNMDDRPRGIASQGPTLHYGKEGLASMWSRLGGSLF